jgi:predicted transcriptional regulator
LYEQLKATVEKIRERLEQKHILSGLGVTNLSEVLKNNEVLVEMIMEAKFSEGTFDVLFLVKKEEILKMRKKKAFVFRSHVIPGTFLKVIIDNQKVIYTIYKLTIPGVAVVFEGVVKEELKEFVRSHKEIKEFVINHR